jgi:magnesium chelatase family protein
MGLAVLYSRALSGMEAALVTVEVHIANGLPNFTIVGLPETEVKESKDRVRAALQNCQFEFPARRITVNLAPADLPKESGRFDLLLHWASSLQPDRYLPTNFLNMNMPASSR